MTLAKGVALAAGDNDAGETVRDVVAVGVVVRVSVTVGLVVTAGVAVGFGVGMADGAGVDVVTGGVWIGRTRFGPG